MERTQRERVGLIIGLLAACLIAMGLIVAGPLAPRAHAVQPQGELKAVLTAAADADLATQATKYPIWVGGKQVTSANKGNVLKDKKKSVKYNPSTNTLTLKSAKIKKASVVKEGIHTFRYGIRVVQPQGITIVLKGTSTITVPGKARDASHGISSYSGGEARSILVKGSGSLKVKAGKSGGYSSGITCSNLNIQDSAKVTSSGGSAGSKYGSYGVHARGYLGLFGSARLTAVGKTRALSTSATYGQSYTPQVKAGNSAKNIIVNQTNPASSVYTSYKYVSIAKAKASGTKPAKMAFTKVAPIGGGFIAEWKALKKNCTGYQLQLTHVSTGKVWTFSSTNPTLNSATIDSLTGGAEYTVRIRALNKVGSETYYGAWSAPRSVTPYAGNPAG